MITYPLALGAGFVTRVIEAGQRGDRPAVLVHGLGARADRWRHNLDALAGLGLRAVALDLPGHGFASKGASVPHTIPGLRDTLLRLLDVLRDDGAGGPAVLVGTSLGGHVCAAVAAAAPERVSHLLMVGSLGLEPLGEERREGFGQRVVDTSREAIAEKLHRLVADESLVTPAWLEEEFRINNSPGAGEFFRQIARYLATGIDDHVVGDELRQLSERLELALLWGGKDAAVPVDVGRRAQERYGLPLTVFDACAHAPYLEEPERFNEVLTGFLTG